MVGVTNVALGYCKIKSYIVLFLAFVCGLLLLGGISGMSTSKKPSQDYEHARGMTILSVFGIVVFTLSYFFLRTSVGCGFSIASNAFSVLKQV